MAFLKRLIRNTREGEIWSSISGSNMNRVPLNSTLFSYNDAFPEVGSGGGGPQVSLLDNGVRVASLAASSPVSCVGVALKGGSRDEPRDLRGISQFIEWMTWRTTMYRSHFDIVRSLSARAANMSVSTTRELQFICAEVMPDYAKYVVDVIGDSINSHKYTADDVESVRMNIHANLQYPIIDGGEKVIEALHAAAYYENSLGFPIGATEASLKNITPQSLFDWNRSHFTPSRLAVVGIGVDHEELVSMAQSNFGKMIKDTPTDPPAAKYTGGFQHTYPEGDDNGSSLTHVALGFEVGGFTTGSLKEYVAVAVLTSMMGGGSSFSAGGPGKGMYSRLFVNGLNKHFFLQSLQAYSQVYSDSGLFAIQGSGPVEHADKLTDVIVNQLLTMGTNIDKVEFERAKNLLLQNMFTHLESRHVLFEEFGTQLLMNGELKTPYDFVDMIKETTAADVQNVVNKLLKSKLSMSVVGNATHVPHFDQVREKLQQ